MHRRTALCFGMVALLALVAGCSAPGSIDMQAVNDSELAAEASRSLDELAPVYMESEKAPREIVRSAIENGTTTVTAISAPLELERPFEYQGGYYTVDSAVIERGTANAVGITADFNTTSTNGSAIEFADLPTVDQDALSPLFPPRMPPRPDDSTIGIGAIYTDAELERSVLAPVQQYDAVIVDGKRYALSVEEPRTVSVETYRYEATKIADSASAFADYLREMYAFTLSGLSEAEREVITEAIDDGQYYADSDDDAGFESLVDRFRSQTALVEDQVSGTWIVWYNGELYVADLRFSGYINE